ncbi:MAG TPA: diguanylate cyclase [bacterium]
MSEKSAMGNNNANFLAAHTDIQNLILNSMRDAVTIIDVNSFTIVGFNQAFLDQVGLTAEQVQGKHCYEITHQRDSACNEFDHSCPLLGSLKDHKQATFDHVHFCRDGRKLVVEVSATPLTGENGRVTYMVHVSRDVTERRKAEDDLIKMKKAVEASGEIMFLTDRQGMITFINPEFTRIYGYTVNEVVGKTTPRILKSMMMKKEDYEQFWKTLLSKQIVRGTIVNKTKSERLVHMESSANPIIDKDGNIIGFLAIQRDITDRLKAEERLNYLAYHDALTGLPNRQLFNDRVNVMLGRASRFRLLIAIMMLDVDNFKDVNDTLGHDAGDQLLQLIARRMASVVREIDTVARMGGDEFIFMAPDLGNIGDAEKLTQRILDAFKKPFEINGNPISTTASIGISLYPSDGDDVQNLMKTADIAMYRAKAAGRNSYRFYSQK